MKYVRAMFFILLVALISVGGFLTYVFFKSVEMEFIHLVLILAFLCIFYVELLMISIMIDGDCNSELKRVERRHATADERRVATKDDFAKL
ncbi:hypothetical protein BK011_06825 [Tenericutes bacterium MZ-XQ]|nr:hypothetical protein BK011_06825 [Tenericutes bacterium MZ-XQ]